MSKRALNRVWLGVLGPAVLGVGVLGCGGDDSGNDAIEAGPSATASSDVMPTDTSSPLVPTGPGTGTAAIPPGTGTGPDQEPTGTVPVSTTEPTATTPGSGTAPEPTTTGDPPDPDDPATSCVETAPIGQRLLRLNYAQLANTAAELLGPEALAGVTLDGPRQREFQPLFAAEGGTITTPVLQKSLEIARSASDSIATRFADVTGCTEPAMDACALGFLADFASRAFRRPATAEEQASVDTMYAEIKTAGLSVVEATQYALQGILLSPASLYRTEFGVAGGDPALVNLDPYEMASALSYFLSDGPPDDVLLAAASDGSLATAAGVEAQVARLLQSEEVRNNLTQVMMAYYRMGDIDSTVKSNTVFPEEVFNVGLRNAMYTETQMFLSQALWQGELGQLLLSRDTFVNAPLAAHYGVEYPAEPGGDPQQDFVAVQLPEGQRSGILTQASIMTMRSVPDTTSVVARGLFVNSAFLCLQRPPAPPTDPDTQEAIDAQVEDRMQTEREKADHRAMTSPCLTCHSLFDAYGLVLENYDAIGRYRTDYDDGTLIDTASPTPPTFVNAAANLDTTAPATLTDVNAFIGVMNDSGLFARCMTANMLKYAAAAPVVDANECVVSETFDALPATQTFSDLIQQVALSRVVSQRSVEAAQ